MHDEKETAEIINASFYRRDAAGAEKKAALPGEDDPYRAAGNGGGDEIAVLVLVTPRPPYHFFEYPHIGNLLWDETPAGEVIRFVYSGFEPKLVLVHGEGLLRLCHQIGLRQIPWIRQADRDFRPAGARSNEPVITRFEVTDWVRPKPQAVELARALEEA
jgi:hypothetical protein